jgi:hypothetical protein
VGKACGVFGGEEECIHITVGKLEGKRTLGRQRHKWVDNIKVDLLEIGCGGVDWIFSGSGKGQLESCCECGNESSGSIKCWETIEWLHNWWPLE